MKQFKISMNSRPYYLSGNKVWGYLPIRSVEKGDERAVTLQFVANRKLFGECYRILRPKYFNSAKQGHGVMVAVEVDSKKIIPDMNFPGDIDILIIPYEGNKLIVSDTLAIEVKVIRASFERQNKSPNQFGFSQAESLLKHGFPFVAVAHLVVSNASPPSAWREVLVTTIIDDEGVVGDLLPYQADMLPADLISRAIGRLQKNCKSSELGLISAYVDFQKSKNIFLPSGRKLARNPVVNIKTFKSIANFYNSNWGIFFDTPAVNP